MSFNFQKIGDYELIDYAVCIEDGKAYTFDESCREEISNAIEFYDVTVDRKINGSNELSFEMDFTPNPLTQRVIKSFVFARNGNTPKIKTVFEGPKIKVQYNVG